MTLQAVQSDGEVESPTDHPHVHEQTAPPLPQQDQDDDYYLLSVGGSGAALTFFTEVFKDQIDQGLYRNCENRPHGGVVFNGIGSDDITDVIDVFERVINQIEDIQITGSVNGSEWVIDIWDGEPNEKTISEKLDDL